MRWLYYAYAMVYVHITLQRGELATLHGGGARSTEEALSFNSTRVPQMGVSQVSRGNVMAKTGHEVPVYVDVLEN